MSGPCKRRRPGLEFRPMYDVAPQENRKRRTPPGRSREGVRFLLAALLLLLLPVLVIGCREPQESTPSPPPASEVFRPEPRPTVTAKSPSTAGGDDTYLPFTAHDSRSTATPPASATLPASPEAVPRSTSTPVPPAYPTYEGPPLDRDEIGIQIHLHREALNPVLNHVAELGAGWVKVQVSWKLYESAPGEYDAWRFRELDHLVSGAAGRDLKVLLSVAKAPEWSRPTAEMDGPPGDFALFGEFMHYLAARYQGNVAAYELWNEPNLRREWNGVALGGEALARLVSIGADGVRRGDPQALTISAAPATTGINDGMTAIDDRVFLRQMVASGVGDVVDGIGVHPYGWANPPDASASDREQVAPTHNDHPSFFFRDTLETYRTLLDGAGYADLPLWVTEFGWGSFERFEAAPPPEASFMAHVTEWQQAVYALEALRMGHDRSGVGPMFLWNLNFAPTFGADFSASGYSLLRPDGSPRPVYLALQDVPKE